MYLGWFDDNPKKANKDKIAEACAAYVARFQMQPNVVLVNRDDATDDPRVRVEGYIRKNNFWVGWEDH